MASLNELAEVLAERAGRQFSQPFNMEMKALIHLWRSRLTRDTLERNRQDRIFFRQWFEVPLELTNLSHFPGFPDIPVMRSVCKVPNPLRANGIVFDYIGSPDRMSQFQVFTEQHELIPALNARYTGRKIKVLYMEERLYVFNTLVLPVLLGASVFDDVMAVEKYGCNCNKSLCYDDDCEYPVPREIQQKIIQSIMTVELRIPPKPEDKLVNEDEPQKTEESYRS
jgi:hypothetical protein